MKKIFLAVFICSLFSVNAQEGSELADKIVRKFLAETPVPGLAVTVMQGEKIVWSNGYGYADLENQIPVDPSTSLFRIGSVSKPFTAAALGRLFEQGKLDLDKEIQDYVTYFPAKEHPVTVRQVAGHIGGIRHYFGGENLSAKPYKNVRHSLSIFKDDPLIAEPGTEYNYSSYGWNLLSAVVEEVSGQDFLLYMRDSVFDAMGLQHTYADEPDKLLPGRGRYYFKEGGGFINAPYVDNSYKWAGGGFLSTSDDVAYFGHLHLNNKFLSATTFAEWTKSQSTADGKNTSYGIGWRSGIDEQGNAWVGHSGGSIGGTTMLYCYPEHDLVVALIVNMSSAQIGNLARKIGSTFIE